MEQPRRVHFDDDKNTTKIVSRYIEKSKKPTAAEIKAESQAVLQAQMEILLAQMDSLKQQMDSLETDSSETESVGTVESFETEESSVTGSLGDSFETLDSSVTGSLGTVESLETAESSEIKEKKENSDSKTRDVNIKQRAPVRPSRQPSLRENDSNAKATGNNNQELVSPKSPDRKPKMPQRQGSLRKNDSNSMATGTNNQASVSSKMQESLPKINLEPMAESNSPQAQSSEIINGKDMQAFVTPVLKEEKLEFSKRTPKPREQAKNNDITTSKPSKKGQGLS